MRPPRAFQRLPRSVREQQMLDAAVVVFARRGFHAATVDDIAEAAGISKPMVYAYLGTKEELFVACLTRETARLVDSVTTAAAEGPPTDQRLWRGLRAFFAFVADYRDGWRVLYRQARGQEPFAQVLAELRGRMAQIVFGLLAAASVADGALAEEENLRTLAFAVVGAAEVMAEWVVEPGRADPDTAATRLMTALWSGAGPVLRGHTWR